MDLNSYFVALPKDQEEILLSWGLNNTNSIENGIQFSVNGFLFKGIVKVIFNETDNTFSIRLMNPDDGFDSQKDGVKLNELINSIDMLVEKNCSLEAYRNQVKAQYENR